jgi:hypothetical protein
MRTVARQLSKYKFEGSTGGLDGHTLDNKYIGMQNRGRKTWERRTLGRPWPRWCDKIKMDLKDQGGVSERIHLAKEKDQCTVM